MKNRFSKFVGFAIMAVFIGFFTFANAQDSVGGKGATSDVGTSPAVTNPPASPNNSGNNTVKPEYSNINSPLFRLLICDGPAQLVDYNPATRKIEPGFNNPDFIPCDFRGLMMQIQHLINIAMTLGILIAVAGLVYAGYLYISGTPKNIAQAHEIFPSLAKGFIIMLAAWFIVYQILEWLTGTNGYGVLLGL